MPSNQIANRQITFTRNGWPDTVSMGNGSIAINAGLFIYMNNEAEYTKSYKKYIDIAISPDYQAAQKRLPKIQYRANSHLKKC